MLPGCGCSVAQSCLTLCDHMAYSTPGLPVHHHLLELAQTQVHWVSDAIQPSCPLLSPSPPAFNLSQPREGNKCALGSKSKQTCQHFLRTISWYSTPKISGGWVGKTVLHFQKKNSPLDSSWMGESLFILKKTLWLIIRESWVDEVKVYLWAGGDRKIDWRKVAPY